ncbi:hypothetical protein [Peribacillus deserti]|uniref:Uncharacterized protein n=1 Tax=Peribacillus deserti TaxID=673318 RepID=A0A2N5M2W1_9BACI|nr:hypothetical protein [Peribacillus deserti]PLT28709.1 hypothetical protein CUU66_17020 [Peribacillus deserti]
MEEYERNKHLLESYLSLWNNRTYSESSVHGEAHLIELIKRELLDENSHPRIRKSKQEKFFLSTERIIHSPLDDSMKVSLISLYTEIYTKI